MFLACSSLACALDDYPDLRDALTAIKGLGFDALDLAAFEGWQNIDPSALAAGTTDFADVAPRLIADAGLRVVAINGSPSRQLDDPDPEAWTAYRAEFVALLELAHALNCPKLTVQPGRFLSGIAFDTLFETMRARSLALADLAAGAGIVFSLEAHQGSILESPQACERLFAEVFPVIGLTYDPSHFVMQGISVAESEPLMRYAQHVHVRQAKLDQMQATMADGIVDMAACVAGLERVGYDGALSLEYFRRFDRDLRETVALREHLISLGVSDEVG